jgi:uncharacterized protein (TIGR03790 family)
MRRLLATATLWLGLNAAATAALTPAELGVVVNVDDPQSVAVAAYYAERRGIPAANIVRLGLGSPRKALSPAAFERARGELIVRMPVSVQALAITWTYPYRVGCMSLTTAFALGYGTRHCAEGCRPIAPNPYYDATSDRPFADLQVRPTMMLAAASVDDAKHLIDRGVRSDGSQPAGRAYLVMTSDRARSSRAPRFPAVRDALGARLPVVLAATDGIRGRDDVMFYFTGATHVPWLDTLRFLPGALADHLTSQGGRLEGTGQMSALRWLEAGATASYGTVVEPCNFPQKFPDPGIAMRHYLDGDTAVEAYWKSVVWPGQGLFIGEPLARPYAPDGAGVPTAH